jgi:hypothetical protein
MSKRAPPAPWLWVILVVPAVALAGCSSNEDEPVILSTLQVEQYLSSTFTPQFYVNVTEQDFVHFPALGELLHKWENGNMNGSYDLFAIPYPHGDGLVIIRALQDRVPQGYWRISSVDILYKGVFLNLSSLPPPHAD